MQRAHRAASPDHGFTLIELLIVVSLIGVLVSLVASAAIRNGDRAKRDLARTKIRQIGLLLEQYKLDQGMYPTTEQGLAALLRAPDDVPAPRRYPEGGYAVDEDALLDPWRQRLTYTSPGEMSARGYDLCSLGPDPREDGSSADDDICSYKRPDPA